MKANFIISFISLYLSFFASSVVCIAQVKKTKQDSIRLKKFAPLLNLTDSLLSNMKYRRLKIERKGISRKKIHIIVGDVFIYKGYNPARGNSIQDTTFKAELAYLHLHQYGIDTQTLYVLAHLMKKYKLNRFFLSKHLDHRHTPIGESLILDYKNILFYTYAYYYYLHYNEEELKKERKAKSKHSVWVTEHISKFKYKRFVYYK